jgi:NAD(P)-dependent dehydrogenase (short-subunit alcohol dehydrogenase family)
MEFWRNKRAVVTGGSSGLGRALAGELVSRGARVALVARGQAALDTAAEQLRGLGGEVIILPSDVTDREQVAQAAGEIMRRWGGVDLVAHCAGRSMRGNALSTSPAEFRDLWEANLLSSVHLAQAFADSLSAERGSLVLLGSLASKVAPRYLGAYPSSKHAVAALAQQLRLESAERGMHVLLVCPGPIARDEGARRYVEGSPPADVPAAAYEPAGGAKVRRIDPQQLAARILQACERRRAELIVPSSARFLFALCQISPRMGDWFLRKFTVE